MEQRLDVSPKTCATEQPENIKDQKSQANERWVRAEKYFKTAFYWYVDSLRGARWFVQGLGFLRSVLMADSLTTRYQNLATEMPIEHLQAALKKMGAPAEIPLLSLPLEENYLQAPAQTQGDKVILVTPELMSYFMPHEQEIIVGHEYDHLKNHIAKICTLVNLVLPIATYFSLIAYDYVVRYSISKACKHYAPDPKSRLNKTLALAAQMHHKIVTFPLVNYLLNLYLYSKFSQHCEFTADVEAARLLNNKDGAISTLMKCHPKIWEIILKQVKPTSRKPSNCTGSNLLINLAFVPIVLISWPLLPFLEVLRLFDEPLGCADHPSISQRINNLKTL